MKIVMGPNPAGSLVEVESFIEDLRSEFPQVAFHGVKSLQEQIEQVRDADVYYGWPSREVFLAAPRLRWVHCPGTGVDSITAISELVESDVVLTNARGSHAPPMADHVMGMIINLAHRWREMFDDQRAHRWETGKYSRRQVELSGRTMGILAMGDIGSQVARRAHGFGMQVYAVDKHPERVLQRNAGTVPPGVKELWGLERLDDLLGMSDWFVVAPALTPESRGMIDRRRVGLLKEGAYLIVISRGGIVDEEALIDALRSGRLAGAGLDTFAKEPLPEDSPFWDTDNVVITPHGSALTPEMYEGRRQIFRENLRRFLNNESFLYVCDKRGGF